MHFTKVALTGGIASGKSAVAELWRANGAAVIDSDQLAHRALEPGTPTHAALVSEFGTEILKADNTINRSRLGAIVFADADRRTTLNQIVHPVVQRQWQEAVAEIERAGQCAVAVVAIPLLFEAGLEKEFDQIVVVGCSVQTQVGRLAAKGLNEPDARARLQAQLPTQTKMDRGHFVIWNDGSRSVLNRQAAMIWNQLKEN